jgi:hypothetical protein
LTAGRGASWPFEMVHIRELEKILIPALTRDLKIVMDENNLEIPFNQLVVHQTDKSSIS